MTARLSKLRARVLSIAVMQASGLAATLSYVLLLSDDALVMVVAVMSLFGLISAAVSSNVTTKVYAHTAAGDEPGALARLALRLLVFEQVGALVLALALAVTGLEALASVSLPELLALSLLASNASTSAFVKYRDETLIRLNYLRAATTALRAGAIHLLALMALERWVASVVIASLALVYGYALWVAAREARGVSTQVKTSLIVSLREYLFGVPVSLIRSVFDQGILIVAVELLTPQDLRLFRFLLLPKDIINRLFNAALPVIFDRLYVYRLSAVPTAAILATAAGTGALWFWIGTRVVGGGWEALLAFMAFLAMNTTVYSMLPIMWRAVHRNRSGLNLVAMVFTTSVTGAAYLILDPDSLTEIFIVMAVYYLCYVLTMLAIFRIDRVEAEK